MRGVVGLDPRKCPYCRKIRESITVKIELLKSMGAPEEMIAKLEKQKYCPFHSKVLRILYLERIKAERVFSINESEKSFRINFGYRTPNHRATLLLIIPKKFKGTFLVMANGRSYITNHEILNLLTTKELHQLSTLLPHPNTTS